MKFYENERNKNGFNKLSINNFTYSLTIAQAQDGNYNEEIKYNIDATSLNYEDIKLVNFARYQWDRFEYKYSRYKQFKQATVVGTSNGYNLITLENNFNSDKTNYSKLLEVIMTKHTGFKINKFNSYIFIPFVFTQEKNFNVKFIIKADDIVKQQYDVFFYIVDPNEKPENMILKCKKNDELFKEFCYEVDIDKIYKIVFEPRDKK